MVNVEQIKLILKHCPNYDKIIDYGFKEGDRLSASLIDWYRELVFSVDSEDMKQINIIKNIDKALGLYVEEHKYLRGLKQIITADEISLIDEKKLKSFIKKIIQYTENYENKSILEIESTIWI